MAVESIDTQQVCLNGHQITDSVKRHPKNARKHCPECGAATITQCPECSAPIPGHKYYTRVFVANSEEVPSHCHNCGNPYPWTKRREAETEAVAVEGAFNPLIAVEKVCKRFHLVAKQLTQRRDKRQTINVTDEYDVQDLLHSLLRVFFDDIRPEEWTPSYAGKCSRMDFLLKGHDIVVEAKMSREGLGAKELGTQLIDDIARYKKHPECRTLVCFVYDPAERIANPVGLENDLSGEREALMVNVWIVPSGY